MYRKLIILNILLLLISTAEAITYVNDNIQTDTRWSKKNGPYIIVNDIIVKEGVTLIIDPGTVVKFSAETKILVYGTVRAKGTKSKKIHFSGKDNCVWNGFEFLRTCGQYDTLSKEGCVFEHCRFNGLGEAPAHLIRSRGCNLMVTNCEIINCYTAIQSERQAHVYILKNKFTNCNRPINVRNTSIATIKNNKMIACNSVVLGGTTEFKDNLLKHFTSKGRHSGLVVWMLGGGIVTIEKNKFIGFEDYALKLQKMSRRSSLIIRNNTFKDNGVNLKLACNEAGKGTVKITQNNFLNYKDTQIRLFAPCDENPKNVTFNIGENYWGKLNNETLKSAIYDKSKDDKINLEVLPEKAQVKPNK